MFPGNTLTPGERLSRYLSVLESRSFALASAVVKLAEMLGGEEEARRIVSLLNSIFYQNTGLRWDNVLVADVSFLFYDQGRREEIAFWENVPKQSTFPKGVSSVEGKEGSS